jgi:hypothetical protein
MPDERETEEEVTGTEAEDGSAAGKPLAREEEGGRWAAATNWEARDGGPRAAVQAATMDWHGIECERLHPWQSVAPQ